MFAMIDNDTILPAPRPLRYAEVGQSELETPLPLPRPNKGHFPRTQNGVALVPIGLASAFADAIDPRTEDPDHEMAELEPRDYASIYAETIKPPVDQAEITRRLTLLESHARPGIELAQILAAADLLGIGQRYDLAHFLATNQPAPAGIDTTILTDQWGQHWA